MAVLDPTAGPFADDIVRLRSPVAARSLHILMVSARYFPFMGGIETHIHEVGRRLVARGHRVSVLTTDPGGTWLPEEHELGMYVQRVKAWPARRDYYIAPDIHRTLMKGSWDVVHVQGYNTFVAPLALAAAVRRRLPFVLTFHSGGHSSVIRQSIRRLQQRLLAPLAAHASQLIAVSEFEADLFSQSMKLPRDRFVVIPNGASMPATEGDARETKTQAGPLVLSIGRLERYKGHHKVIEAFPEVLRRAPEARLRVLGEGPYEKTLRGLVENLRLEKSVSIGAIPPGQRARLADVIRAADLVVLLSEYEAHPVAVMEALALKRQVLVSDTSGLRELAQKGLCRAIPLSADKNAIAVAIVDSLQNHRAVGEIAIPDWESCVDRLVSVYQTAATGGGTHAAA